MIAAKTIDDALAKVFAQPGFQEAPAGLYDPLRYMIAIGGKRIRPRLCLTTYGLFASALTPEIVNAAAGLEIFHTFTLIHDDIMDRSPLRRGHATVWKKWDEDTAILSGDAMCIDAYKRIANAPREVLPEALELFSRTAAEVCDGQQMDMDFERQEIVPMDAYMQMIGLKTGVLIACSAQMGALLAGAGKRAQQGLYDYGYYLGLAFQVADDYLDAYGDEKVFGKPIGGDILNEKKSWLTIRAYEKGAQGLEEAMKAPAGTAEEKAAKIARVKAIYDSCGVAADATETIGRLSSQAIEKGFEAVRDEAGRAVLEAFAQSLVGRRF